MCKDANSSDEEQPEEDDWITLNIVEHQDPIYAKII
jgi:hypothetical protein